MHKWCIVTQKLQNTTFEMRIMFNNEQSFIKFIDQMLDYFSSVANHDHSYNLILTRMLIWN